MMLSRPSIILLALALMAVLAHGQKRKCDWKARSKQNPEADAFYHYIIVGGGTTGLIAAYRLSQDPLIKVLVLENGADMKNDNLTSQYTTELFDVPYCDPFKGECPAASLPMHLIDTPLAVPWASHTDGAHQFVQSPQLYSNKKDIQYPRGRHLGGSTLIHYMNTVRGTPPDFDEMWTKKEGLKGWNYSQVLPYYNMVETADNTTGITGTGRAVPRDKYHGSNGPVCTSTSSQHWDFPLWDEVEKAAVNLGIPKTADISNGNAYYGVAPQAISVCPDGKRSTARAYLTRAEKEDRVCFGDHTTCPEEKNLHVMTNTHVIKIEMEKVKLNGVKRHRATGVRTVDNIKHPFLARTYHPTLSFYDSEATKFRADYSKYEEQPFPEGTLASLNQTLVPGDSILNYIRKQNASYFATLQEDSVVYKAKREVIMAAGVFVTPQILMLSGIGPQEHLESKQIECIADLPVGQNLQDHDEFLFIFKDRVPNPLFNISNFNSHLGDWLYGKASPLGSNSILGTLDISSHGTIDPKINKAWPKSHSLLSAFYFEQLDNAAWREHTVDKRIPRSLADIFKWEALNYKSWLTSAVHDCAPGRILLRNKDPLQPAIVDLGLGGCQDSIDELIHAVRTIRKIMAALPPGMEVDEFYPGAEIQSDEDLQQYIEQAMWSHQACCTASMGPCSGRKSVTDERGRVYFVDGLRVVDISALPAITLGNPWITAAMTAEKITAHLIQDYKGQDA